MIQRTTVESYGTTDIYINCDKGDNDANVVKICGIEAGSDVVLPGSAALKYAASSSVALSPMALWPTML